MSVSCFMIYKVVEVKSCDGLLNAVVWHYTMKTYGAVLGNDSEMWLVRILTSDLV
jgi:hypothetical protein